ncbi:hypothetical protein CNBE3140 [Cryptococcus deneoformans B-3501A]|uniref:hypothetical protein n=1 Tax=Cryptococcus deneoformans (strain B-3501A) TaxID=283643 RepID=UPI000042CBFF|nr:hypothetical protein CNBE3140 [Cryptococcus neoformans var. neoformans B-3501A]EAL20606.1 hypothetical protein CNBE3140 [Cryptococcus neoformans var. neoformans B-3501A]
MSFPTLKHFIVQAELLQAYRSAVRATKHPQTRRETLDFLRSDLERLRQEHDLDTLQSHLSSFRKLVKQMRPSFSFSGNESGSRLIGQRRRAQG